MRDRRLIVADVAAIAAAFAAAWALFDAPLLYDSSTTEPIVLLVVGLVAWTLVAHVAGLADRLGVASLLTLGVWVLLLVSWLAGKHDPDVEQLSAFWLFAVVALTLVRGAPRLAPPRRPPTRLALADALALLTVCLVSWPLLKEPKPADSTGWAVVFLLIGIPAWIAAAAERGQYDAPASLWRDLTGALVLATFGAWTVVVISPHTGEIDPDINQLFGVWALAIVAVAVARQLGRATR